MPVRKLTIRWALAEDDLRMTSFHFNCPGAVDREDDVEALADAWWAAIDHLFPGLLVLVEYRWYFATSFPTPPADWGDADRIIPRSLPGGGAAAVPPQCAIVVGYPQGELALRKSHPRNYLPGPATAAMANTGKLNAGVVVELANAMDAFLQGCYDIGYWPGFVRRSSIPETNGFHPYETIRIDDAVDTQRRRAYEDPSSSTERTLEIPAP